MDDIDIELSPFQQLPEEMFLHICSFLDVKDIVLSLSRVCKQFYYFLQNENLWRSWIYARWGRQYPIYELEENEIMDWREACLALDTEHKTWSARALKMTKCGEDIHSSDIDAVLLFDGGMKCFSASRDRYIALWELDDGTPRVAWKKNIHDGWVWRLKMRNNTLYSASWDNTIKMWELTSELTERQEFKCDTAVISMDIAADGCVFGGCWRRAFGFDPRSGPIAKIDLQSAVVTLNFAGEDLLLGCEGNKLAIWDKRTQTVRQTLAFTDGNYPLCSEMDSNILYVGDRLGNVRLYKKKVNGSWSEAAVVNMGTSGKIQAMRVHRGVIMTASNQTVQAALPLKPIMPVLTHTLAHVVCALDACNGTLAIGSGISVEFFS